MARAHRETLELSSGIAFRAIVVGTENLRVDGHRHPLWQIKHVKGAFPRHGHLNPDGWSGELETKIERSRIDKNSPWRITRPGMPTRKMRVTH